LVERHPNSADEREKLMMCSINLSGQSLGDDKFLPFVIDQFHRSGLDASKICFEITETAAVASFSQANRFIQALKELGCKFALDDFGTGLSSFGYLKHFPVDFLKIDGSFVREILRDPIDLRGGLRPGVRGGAASAGVEVGCCLRGECQPH
jgi:EAL domain-containing protein (putative c-di-GMP-specific phosphodiesterase class I)